MNIDEESENIVATPINLNIVFEDDSLLILNKPAGIAVHPSILHYTDSLSNGVKYYFDTIGLKRKIRPVNRLDLNTSGLIIFAKNEYIQEALIQQMNKHIFVCDIGNLCKKVIIKKSCRENCSFFLSVCCMVILIKS